MLVVVDFFSKTIDDYRIFSISHRHAWFTISLLSSENVTHMWVKNWAGVNAHLDKTRHCRRMNLSYPMYICHRIADYQGKPMSLVIRSVRQYLFAKFTWTDFCLFICFISLSIRICIWNSFELWGTFDRVYSSSTYANG